jgi:Ni/Co efflux regulator RcnB
MHFHLKYLAMGLLAAALSVSVAGAKDGGKGGGKGNKHAHKEKTPPGHANKHGKKDKPGKDLVVEELWLPAVKVDEARRFAILHDFSGQKPLPPGIRKNLMRGKPLPPGIAKKRLPDPYMTWLPGRPGYEWRAYGTDLVLVAPATGLVAHVVVDVLR